MSHSDRRGNGLFCFCLIWAFLMAGCGVKAPPAPPRLVPLPAAGDLEASVEDGILRLSWSIPADERVAGYAVLRSRMPLSEGPCLDCPLVFERVGDRVLTPEIRETGQALYTEQLTEGYAYTYKVAPYGEDVRTTGEESKAVTFTYE